MSRETLIDEIVTTLLSEELLNTSDFTDIDNLCEVTRKVITSELENVVLISGRVLL